MGKGATQGMGVVCELIHITKARASLQIDIEITQTRLSTLSLRIIIKHLNKQGN